ncbi:hypothetical protein LSCM4_01425 [Leishmania orientalis]|uniref:Proteophosphoglycan ppg4 n=1 Tax=Leishmania orientalis TaxID=2249476 RepID=A0A836K7Q5_9TRYP|nr:hypothetical protein LSCM4_01425 [Leishmania orientalis]
MTLVCAFVAAVVLSGASNTVAALSAESHGHERLNGHTAASGLPQVYEGYATEVFLSTVLPSSRPRGDRGGAAPPCPSRWQVLSGSCAYRDGFFAHPLCILCLVLVFLAIGTYSLARWCCWARRLHRSQYSVVDASSAEDEEVVRSRDAVMVRRGLLSGRQNSPQEVSESEGAMRGAARSGFFRFRTLFHADHLTLSQMRLWRVLQHAPVGLFGTAAQPTGLIGEPEVTETMVVDCGEGSSEGVFHSCNRSQNVERTAVNSARASHPSPHAHAELFFAASTTTSSDDSNDRSAHRNAKRFDDSVRDRRCSCESDPGNNAHTEVEHPALRGAATEGLRSPFHIWAEPMPHPTRFRFTPDTKEQMLPRASDGTGENGRQPCGALVPMTCSTASEVSGASSSYTVPPPTDTPELSRRDSGSSLCADDADTLGDTLCTRVALPHVDTAIFDAEVAHHISLRIADDVCEGGFLLPALPSCEVLCSTVGSHISDLEYVAPPSAHASTAAPSPALNAASCVPLNGLMGAALPRTGSLNSGLGMLDGDVMNEVVEGTAPSPSDAPALQLQRPPEAEPSKPRSKRRSTRYYEPWQPVLVACKTPSLDAADAAAAAASASISTLSTPSLPACDQAQQSSVTRELENDLDDLMLSGEVDSAHSSTASDCTGVFSGGSWATLCTLTPTVETERDAMKRPLAMTTVYHRDADHCTSLEPRTLLATASNLRHPTSPLLAVYSRTAGATDPRVSACGVSSCGECCRLSPSAGQRPSLNLSVEERTLLLKSKSWLFPLIDGTEEIEQDDDGSSRQCCPPQMQEDRMEM